MVGIWTIIFLAVCVCAHVCKFENDRNTKMGPNHMDICLIFERPPPEPTFRRPRGHLEQGREQVPQVLMNPQKP